MTTAETASAAALAASPPDMPGTGPANSQSEDMAVIEAASALLRDRSGGGEEPAAKAPKAPKSKMAEAVGEAAEEPAEEPAEAPTEEPTEAPAADAKEKATARWVRKQLTRLDRDRATVEQNAVQVQRVVQELAPLQRAAALIKQGDHAAGFELLGGDLSTLTEQTLKKGTPDAKADAALAKFEQLQKQLTDERAAFAEQQRLVTRAQAESQFLAMATPEAYPHIALYDADEITEGLHHTYDRLVKRGTPPTGTTKQVLATVAKELEARLSRHHAAKGVAPSGRAAETGKPSKADAKAQKTISNSAASHSSKQRLPETDEEVIEAALQEMRRSRARAG